MPRAGHIESHCSAYSHINNIDVHRPQITMIVNKHKKLSGRTMYNIQCCAHSAGMSRTPTARPSAPLYALHALHFSEQLNRPRQPAQSSLCHVLNARYLRLCRLLAFRQQNGRTSNERGHFENVHCVGSIDKVRIVMPITIATSCSLKRCALRASHARSSPR